MKNIGSILAIGLFALIVSSCSYSQPLLVTDNASAKTGTAEFTVVFGFIRPADTDISIKTAAENGDITKIASVDYVVESKLFRTTYKTVVTGN